MAERSVLDDKELEELARLAPAGSAIGFQLEQGRDGRAWVKPDDAADRAHRAVPRLVEAIRRLQREVTAARDEAERTARESKDPKKAPAPLPDPAKEGAAEALGSLLSAPFTVSPRAVSQAKDDPLKALAVQVAKALADGAPEIERARLIAMALAASQGEMERFWEARKQRASKKAAAPRKK